MFNILAIIYLKKKILQLRIAGNITELFTYLLNFGLKNEEKILLQNNTRFLILYFIISLCSNFGKLKSFPSKIKEILSNFSQSLFQNEYIRQEDYVHFPLQVNNAQTLIAFCIWVFLAISRPKYNQKRSQKDQSQIIAKSWNTNPIKKVIGAFGMISLNDLAILFDNYAQDLKEVYIPSIIFQLDKSYQNFPGWFLLQQTFDFSNKPVFKINLCLFLLEKKEFFKVESFLKELLLIGHEHITRYY